MTAAVLVPRVAADLDRVEQTAEAARSGAKLVLLPKAVLTGLINNDNPAQDLPLGQSIPGPATARLGAVARAHSPGVGFGLSERDGDRPYDSAVLIPIITVIVPYCFLGSVLLREPRAWSFRVVGAYFMPDIALLLLLAIVPDLVQGIYMIAAAMADRFAGRPAWLKGNARRR